MGKCTKGISQFVLLSTNTLIFLIAAGGLGISIYVYYDTAAKAMTRMSLLMAVFIVSIVLMFFSCLGCKTALNAPEKKCSRCLYLTVLLILFIAEFVAAGYIFNLGHALDEAAKYHYDVRHDVDQAAENALVFLHNQLTELYVDESCTGGDVIPSSPTVSNLPLSFKPVACKTQGSTDAFATLLKDNNVETALDFDAWTNCTADPNFIYDGSSKEFTETFCGSEAHIVKLAHTYARYLVWFPVALAGLTFILLVATICMIVQNKRQMRQQQAHRLLGPGTRDGRVQMANP